MPAARPAALRGGSPDRRATGRARGRRSRLGSPNLKSDDDGRDEEHQRRATREVADPVQKPADRPRLAIIASVVVPTIPALACHGYIIASTLKGRRHQTQPATARRRLPRGEIATGRVGVAVRPRWVATMRN